MSYIGSTLAVTARFRNQVSPARWRLRQSRTIVCWVLPLAKREPAKEMKNRLMRLKNLSFLDEEKYGEEDNEIIIFRQHWERRYANSYGSFESTTVVPPMLYTFGSIPKYAIPDNGMQIFYVKVSHIKEEEGLHWPLHVYGLIATRDSIDPRRNLIFHRTRDNSQTITEGVPFLQLTGPSRAVVLIDPVSFEVQLKSKGRTESEDKVICFDILNSQHASGYVGYSHPRIFTSHLRCNQSKIEFAFAVLARSVEATIRVQIVDSAWPEHLGGDVTARTASIQHEGIVLSDSGCGRMPVSDSGVIELSRRVVCVELSGELEVDVVAFRVVDNINSDAAKDSVIFTPKRAAISYGTCDLGFCKLGVTVAWSLLAQVDDMPWGRTAPGCSL